MDTKPPFSSPVKEYTQEVYLCDEDGNQVLDSRFVWKYNEHHNVSEVAQYNSNNELWEVTSYTYNDDQTLKEVTVKVAGGDFEGELKRALFYEYKDGALDQITEIGGDYKIVTKYDDCGNPTEKHNFSGEDLVISTTMYVNIYDQGRLVEKHTVFPSGGPNWVDKFKYNDDGLLIEEQNDRSKLVSIVKHSYNEKGDLILSDFNPGEPNYETLKREIFYNENGDIKVIKEYRKGWCYQDRNDEFGLTGVAMYFYVR